MHLIERLVKSVRQDGVLETVKKAARILADYGFDWKYGTDTMHKVDVDSLETDSDNKPHARRYQASKAHPLLKLFRKLQLPEDGVFVDMGCGKGRVLFIAAQLGFKRVVGIEFCGQLCRQALENAELFSKKFPAMPPVEVIESDATHYDFKGDENIFFLYNPFDSVVLAQVLENIGKSVLKTPRDLWLIYNNPVHHEVVENSRLFAQHQRYEIAGEVFHVYRHHARK
jgi:SAM-dependent methyltransferase